MFLSKKLEVAISSSVLTILLIANSYSILAQTSERPERQPSRPAKWNPQPQQSFVSYWTVESGWNTTLEIRNNLMQRDLSVTPVLRTFDGKEITLPALTLASEQVTGVDLRQALATAAPHLLDKPGSFGSAICRYKSNEAANVFASTIVQRTGTPIGFHFDETDIDTKLDVATIESIWWLPSETSSDLLLLANPSNKPLSSIVTANDAIGHSYETTVKLSPGQTDRLDLRTLTRGAGTYNVMGGLTVSITKGAGSLIVSHIVFDESTGLSALMKTFERNTKDAPEEHTLRAPMLALVTPDPTLGFPSDVRLIPEVLLYNATPDPLNASLTLDWRSASRSGSVPIAVPPLKPGEVRIVDFPKVAVQAQIPGNAYWGTVTLRYLGRYGDIVPIASSFDDSGKYGMQTPFSEGLNRLWKGSMWHADSMRTSIITAGNGGTEATHARLTLFYDKGQNGKNSYILEQLLQPGQQIWADVGALIRNQVPDKDGNVIPTDVMMGSYELRDVDHYAAGLLYEGKLVINKTWGHGYYGCAACCGYGSTRFAPDPYSDIIGNGTSNTVWAYDACTSMDEDVTPVATNWGSSDGTVATVANAYTSLLGDGSATASTFVQINNNDSHHQCPLHTFAPAGSVHVPHHLVVQSDSTGTVCSGNTVSRMIVYSEVDINGMNVGTISTREHFDFVGSNSCLNGNPITSSSCSPDVGGILSDTMTVGCNSMGGSCGYTALAQKWQFCPPFGGTPVTIGAPGDLVVHNDYITVGGSLAFLPGTKIGPNGVFQ